MGAAGFVIGTAAGQVAGAWLYWKVRGVGPAPAPREVPAAIAAGVVTAIVASAVLGVIVHLAGGPVT